MPSLLTGKEMERKELAAQIAASMGIRIDVTKEVQKRHYGNVKAKLPYFLKKTFQLGDVFFLDPKTDCIADYESFFKCLSDVERMSQLHIIHKEKS